MKWWHKNQKTGIWEERGGWSKPEEMSALECAYFNSFCIDCLVEHWVFCRFRPFSLTKKLSKKRKKYK